MNGCVILDELDCMYCFMLPAVRFSFAPKQLKLIHKINWTDFADYYVIIYAYYYLQSVIS